MPLGVALVHALDDQLGHIRQRNRRLHPRHGTHVALEVINGIDELVAAALLLAGLRHDDQEIRDLVSAEFGEGTLVSQPADDPADQLRT